MAENKQVLSFGCRLNIYESEVIKGHLPEGSNTLVVNTCAVTSEAERQARQAIRRAHRENPDAEIVVTGCAAQVNPKAFADMPEVARVVGNQEKLEAATWQATDAQPQRVVVQDIMAVRETAPHLLDGYVEHTRAFVQVQTGCDHSSPSVDGSEIPCGSGLGADGGHGSGSSSGSRSSVSEEGNLIQFLLKFH